MTMIGPSFQYWDSVNPTRFLDHDWANPSRAWGAEQAIAAALANGVGALLEVGAGGGKDYEQHFRPLVQEGRLVYHGVEGSKSLHNALQSRFPEATWQNRTIAELSPRSADVVYARHILEHQPALEPALGQLLGAARRAVVLVWYRPPGLVAFRESWKGVDCQTFARVDVLESVACAGFDITERATFESGDEGWVLTRRP